MRIEDIHYFMSAISKQSMSKAAEDEFLSQQNITNAVKRLEKELGVQLVNRSNKGISLTNHGKMLQPYLNQILLSYSHINTYVQNLEDRSLQTSYKILCLSALSATLIDFVKNVSLYYPNTELSIIEYVELYNPDVINEALTKTTPDILYTIVLNKDLPILEKKLPETHTIAHITTTEFCLYHGINNALYSRKEISIKELRNFPLVFHSAANKKSFMEYVAETYNIPISSCLKTNSNTLMHDLVRNNLFCGMMFTWVANHRYPLIPIKDIKPAHVICIYDVRNASAITDKLLLQLKKNIE